MGIILPRSRALPQGGELTIDRTNPIAQSIVGAVRCIQPVVREQPTKRLLGSSAPTAGPLGVPAHPISSTLGVYTARREFADWEPTANFSLIAYFYLTSLAGSSGVFCGNTSGSAGYRIGDAFGVGTRFYGAGGVSVSTGTWPLNVPILAILTYDGSTVAGYFNGASEGTASGGSAQTYDIFCRLTFGGNPDLNTWTGTGGVWYFALVNRVLTQPDALSLYLNPWQLFTRAQPRYWLDAPAVATPSVLLGQACL